MAWLKRVLLGLALLVLIILSFMAYGLYNIDGLVKSTIEKYGSEAVSSKVFVGQVQVNLREAKVILKNLQVENPAGFTEKIAFSVAYIELDLDESQLNTSKITITKVLVKEPLVTFEHANGEDNLSKLQKNAVAYAKNLTGPEVKKVDNSSQTKIFIHNIDLNDGKILLKDSRLIGASMTLPLPNIHISSIQTGPDGSSPEEIAGQVMENLFSSSRRAVGQSTTSAIDQGAKDLKDAGSGMVSAVKKLLVH